jgi:regulator of sigma E protease
MVGSFLPDMGLFGSVALLMGMVFFHEAGHFLVAKWIGIPVSVFSFGFGPRIFGFSWNETDVRLSLLPLGGYVRLAGQGHNDSGAVGIKQFCKNKSIWTILLFYAGGIIANVLITVAIFFSLAVTSRFRVVDRSALVVSDVFSGMPAAEVGLQPMDRIHKLDGLTFPESSSEDVIKYIQDRPDQTVSILVERNGVRKVFKVVLCNDNKKGSLGIVIKNDKWVHDRRGSRLNDLSKDVNLALTTSAKLGLDIMGSFGKLISNKVSLKEVGGPISIIRAGSEAAKGGLVSFLMFSALLSMNLAVINILPIPSLDGGHIAIFLFERISGKEISEPIKERIFTVGFILLVSLMLMVIVTDVIKVFR